MKTNLEIVYESPEQKVLELFSEGVFCTSSANEDVDEINGYW